MIVDAINTPKVFISYSWTPTEDKNWVLKLAEHLSQDGVFVIIDEWDLQEGQDIHQFIEKMVLDPSISSVLVIANSSYKLKADDKKGGVGKESLIISNEVYQKADQTKFIPVVIEFDNNHNPYLPVFMNGRFFIDMASKTFGSNYEKLLRRLFNMPEKVRPSIGQPPNFLNSLPEKSIEEPRSEVKFIAEKSMLKEGQTANFFNDEISIALIAISYEGKPLQHHIFANIWSPMFATVTIRKEVVGYGIKYKANDEFEIRIVSTSTLNVTFQVTKLIKKY